MCHLNLSLLLMNSSDFVNVSTAELQKTGISNFAFDESTVHARLI